MSDAHSGSSSRDSQHGPVSVAPLKVRRAGRFAAGQVIASSTRLLDDTGGVASRSGTPDLEQTLRSHKLVSEIAIIKPKAGLLEGKRLAFLTFSDYEAEQSVFPGGVNLIPSRHLFLAGTQVSSLRRTLKNSHDANNESLPDLCVVLSDMPRNASGNIDRRALRTWAQNLNEQTYETVRRLEHGKESRTQTTDMEKTLQRLVAQVLRVPRRWIGMDMTFCQAGGDETAAAELSALCMHESINLDASDLLDDVTLEALVTLATERGGPAHNWNSDVGTPFDLAPMQLLYFLSPMGRGHRRKVRRDARYRFNQSFLLRLKDRRSIDDVSAAVETVVAHHAMLRSRFAFVSGKWTQRILPAVPGSFYFARHTVSSVADLEMIMASSQATIDLENGPVFSVDCISLSDEQQMLYLVAHQLAVDLSSWRLVVHDLGQLLETGNLSSRRSMPFRKWIELQKSAVQDLITNDDQVLVPGKSPPSFAYWGLTKVSDTYGEALETSFLLSPDLTEALEGPCNAAYRTESTDIYIACLLLAFAQTFHDRAVPVVWNQELGRSSRNGDVDISQTVGCFTSLSPVAERIDLHDDLFRVLRKVKDGRRRAARLVSRSFDSLFCEPHSWGSSCFDRSFEILFSYSGSLLDPNREGGVLELVHLPDTLLSPSTPDYGSAVGRVAVFEISVVFCDGAAKVRFLYCPNASRQDRISLWISNYEHLLLDAIGRLRYREQQLTLSDVPHLDLTYDGLEKLTNDRLPALGVASLQDVETVYPVTAPQQAILICQMREPGSCVLRIVSEIHSADGEMIDTSRIRLAWGMVTRQHAALRTIFIESVTETGLYDQVVLRNPPPVIQFVDVAPLDDPVDVLNGLPSLEGATNQPPYRLAICTGLGKTLMRFDVSMAACDGASVDIIIDDLRRIYRSQATISSSLKFVYEDYLAFLETARSSQTLAFWQDRLRGVKSCMFPYLTSLPHHRQRSYSSVALETPREDLVVFSRSCGVSVGAVVQLAWALVLRLFSGTDTPCFGYLTEGRTDSVPGLLRAVGSFANVVPFHLVLSEEKSLLECIQETERRIRSALPHQYVSVPELQHALGVKGPRGLLNSCVSFSDLQIGQNLSLPSPASVWIKPVSQSRSSFEVDLVIRFSDTGLTADLCQSVMTEGQAAGLVATFDQALQAIMSSVERSVNGVNILSDRDYAQMLSWNTGGSDTIGSRVLGMTVPDLVVTRAENHPNAPAICAWDGAFVYQELIDTATTLAHHLIDDGAGPRTIIPVVMEKSLWAPVAMLAVLKTGAAFVPLDKEDVDMIEAVFQKLQPKLVVATRQAASLIDGRCNNVIVLDEELASRLQKRTSSLRHRPIPDDAACIIFQKWGPKDIKATGFSHASLSTALLAQGPALRISSKTRVMQLSVLSMDIALSEIFTTLVHGGCVCIPSQSEGQLDFTGAVNRMKVNWTYMTSLLSRKLDLAQLPTLKVVCFRTCTLDEDTFSAWAGKANVVLTYGPAEVCPLGVAFFNVMGPSQLRCIGPPIIGRFWVVDENDYERLMPIGAIGELLIESPILGTEFGSAGVSEGLDSGPVLGPNRIGKVFRTGHRVRYLEDGVLEYVSSKKQRELTINGVVIDAPGIESQLRRCLGQGIEVAVDVLNFPEQAALAAFIELGAGLKDGPRDEASDVDALGVDVRQRIQAAKQLVETGWEKEHLFPSVYIPVAQLPVTRAMTIDRRRLQEMVYGMPPEQLLSLCVASSEAAALGSTFRVQTRALTETEQKLAPIWANVLDMDESSINPSDGFLSVGGDQVLACKLVVACRNAAISVSITDLLRNTSLEDLCQPSSSRNEAELPEPYSPVISTPLPPASPDSEFIADRFTEEIIAPRLGVGHEEIEDVAEATDTQTRRIETGMLRGRGSVDYLVFDFSGSIVLEQLESACRTLVDAHPIMRTVFISYNRKMYQVVLRRPNIEFKRYRCEEPDNLTNLVQENIIKEDQSKPIVFSSPVTRFALVDGGWQRSSLVWRICKAQYDDVSVALLVKDLKRMFDGEGELLGRPSFCEFVRRCQLANSQNGATAYWASLLDGAQITQVVQHRKPYQLSVNTQTLQQRLDVGSFATLGVPFGCFLKAAWAMVLATLSASSDVVFGELVDGRSARAVGGTYAVASVLGPMTNTIPVRVPFPDMPLSPRELLHYVHEQDLASTPFEGFGFSEVVERCTRWPYWSRLSTVVQHQDEKTLVSPQHPKAFRLGSTPCRLHVIWPQSQDVCDLFVYSMSRGEGDVALGVSFCTDRVPEPLAEHALRLLRQAMELLTGPNTEQPIVPSGYQYRTMPQRIPIPARSTSRPVSVLSQATTSRDMGTGAASVPAEHRLPDKQTDTIQSAIFRAWTLVLDPVALGVPRERLDNTAFYDLWGSLIPAAQLAGHINRQLTSLGISAALTMDDVVEHPTMLSQFELVVEKMFSQGQRDTEETESGSAQEADPGRGKTSQKKTVKAALSHRFRRLAGSIPATRRTASTTEIPATASVSSMSGSSGTLGDPLLPPTPPTTVGSAADLTRGGLWDSPRRVATTSSSSGSFLGGGSSGSSWLTRSGSGTGSWNGSARKFSGERQTEEARLTLRPTGSTTDAAETAVIWRELDLVSPMSGEGLVNQARVGMGSFGLGSFGDASGRR